MVATCGRTTVAEVEHLGLQANRPDQIRTPGIFVDRIVMTSSEKRIENRTITE